MSNVKLYKCYKGSCGRCLDDTNPYYTEEEYKEMLDADGRVRCPEGHLECGIQELKPEDYPKPPKSLKNIWIFMGGAAIIILIVVLFFIVPGRSAKESQLPTKNTNITDTASVQQSITSKTNISNEQIEAKLFLIGDSKKTIDDRIAEVSPVLSELFSNSEAPKVKVVGQNGTVVDIKDASDYLKWLAGIVTLKGLKVHSVEFDQKGKIRLLEIEEVHNN